MSSIEYQEFIDRRVALYKKIMTERKLREETAIKCFLAFMDQLNEQFVETLVQSVAPYERKPYILAR